MCPASHSSRSRTSSTCTSSQRSCSRGTVIRFTHNSTDSLARRLARLDPEAGAVVVVDGVYSMTGETAPLAAIADLCAEYGARLVVESGPTGTRLRTVIPCG